jgi:hypothetical protein
MRMLSFNHPKPASSGKPVALMKQAGEPGGAYFAAAPPDQQVSPAAAGSPLCDLHFFVRYSLAEYISFMWQHGGFLIRRRRIRWPASLYMRVKSTATAATHFVLLRRGRQTYEFTIDEHGIVRTGAAGVTLIDWADVTAVRTYSRGFMMVLKRGTLPIPFRCLGRDDETALQRLAAVRKEHGVH